MFTEFLVSITDAPILVRNGSTYVTDSFLDMLTEEVKVLMVAFEPNEGILSWISINVLFDMKLTVKVVATHVNSVEGEVLQKQLVLAILAGFFALAVLVDTFVFPDEQKQWPHFKQRLFDTLLVTSVDPSIETLTSRRTRHRYAAPNHIYSSFAAPLHLQSISKASPSHPHHISHACPWACPYTCPAHVQSMSNTRPTHMPNTHLAHVL